MLFSEKFTKLLALTETQSSKLAKAIHVDASQISRMKTGTRGRPGSPEAIKQISDYFALQCKSSYRLSALAELTNDARVRNNHTDDVISNVIFSWLISEDDAEPMEHIGKFLQSVDDFSLKEAMNVDESQVEDELASSTEKTLVAYYTNEGKREAMMKFFTMILNSEDLGEIYLYTDEATDWLYEDEAFSKELSTTITQLAKKGCRFSRTDPPIQGLEGTFAAIERWLPAYMCGAVNQYYYPHLRDSLHRRTLFVAPGKAAVYSHSLDGQRQSYVTMLCTDLNLVSICYREALDLMRLCKPMMRVFFTSDDELFKSLVRSASLPANGIYMTSSLSMPTLPLEVAERIYRENGSQLAGKIYENLRERSSLRKRILRVYKTVDIMTMADIDEVLAGKAPIPVSKILDNNLMYYTPEEYRMHLQNIVDTLETNQNYEVILTNNPNLKDVILYCKGNSSVLMLKDSNPFAVFEITERRLALSFCDYLNKIVESEQKDRDYTIAQLRSAILRLT